MEVQTDFKALETQRAEFEAVRAKNRAEVRAALGGVHNGHAVFQRGLSDPCGPSRCGRFTSTQY